MVDGKVPLDLIARLTDAQMDEIFGHPRDGEGRLKPPPEPKDKVGPSAPARKGPTLAEALMEAEAVMVSFGLPLEEREKGFAMVRAQYANKGDESCRSQ